MTNRLRQITFIDDWLRDRAATKEDHALKQRYAPQIAEAEKAGDGNRRAEIVHEWQFESDSVLHPVYARKAERLTAKARKYGISVPKRPSNRDADDNDDWLISNATGEWMLTDEAERRLHKEIRDERRSSYEEFRKWATLTFAVVGSILALASVLMKQKSPDPCPRNYYRSDSGECVFALQKAPSQPVAPVVKPSLANPPAPVTKPSPKPLSHP